MGQQQCGEIKIHENHPKNVTLLGKLDIRGMQKGSSLTVLVNKSQWWSFEKNKADQSEKRFAM